MVEIEIGVLAKVNVSIGASKATTRLVAEIDAWEKRRNAEAALASTGCSQPKKPAPKWGALIPKSHAQIRPKSKSQNLCDEVLVDNFGFSNPTKGQGLLHPDDGSPKYPR